MKKYLLLLAAVVASSAAAPAQTAPSTATTTTTSTTETGKHGGKALKHDEKRAGAPKHEAKADKKSMKHGDLQKTTTTSTTDKM